MGGRGAERHRAGKRDATPVAEAGEGDLPAPRPGAAGHQSRSALGPAPLAHPDLLGHVAVLEPQPDQPGVRHGAHGPPVVEGERRPAEQDRDQVLGAERHGHEPGEVRRGRGAAVEHLLPRVIEREAAPAGHQHCGRVAEEVELLEVEAVGPLHGGELADRGRAAGRAVTNPGLALDGPHRSLRLADPGEERGRDRARGRAAACGGGSRPRAGRRRRRRGGRGPACARAHHGSGGAATPLRRSVHGAAPGEPPPRQLPPGGPGEARVLFGLPGTLRRRPP